MNKKRILSIMFFACINTHLIASTPKTVTKVVLSFCCLYGAKCIAQKIFFKATAVAEKKLTTIAGSIVGNQIEKRGYSARVAHFGAQAVETLTTLTFTVIRLPWVIKSAFCSLFV